MAWALLGDVTIGPNDNTVQVGAVTLSAGEDTLWIKATQLSGPDPWDFSFGLLYLVTDEARELGTIKIWPSNEGEVYRMTVGLPPEDLSGVLQFDSRWVNRRWLQSLNTVLTMRFEVQTGISGGSGPSFVSGAFAKSDGTGLEMARVVFPSARVS